MIVRYFYFFFFLFCSIKTYTQEPAHYVIGKGIFDGVHLYSIIQDDTDNSMWITSNKGIYNYNGISFTHHTPKNSKSSALFGLTKDNKGNIFCHNLNGQIFKLHNKKFELYYTITNPKKKNIYTIVFDNENNLFIASASSFTILLKGLKNKAIHKNNSHFPIKNNDILYYFEYNTHTKQYSLIKRYDNKEVTTSTYKERYKVFFIKNKFYSYYHNTRKIYTLKNGTITPLNHLDFLSKKSTNIIFDTDTHLWFCNATKGAYLLPKNEFETPKKHNELFKEYIISGGIKDNENNIWLLTFNKGIINIPNLKNSIVKSPNNFDFKAITKTNNQLYIATENGQIYKLNQHTFSPFFKLDKNDRVEHLKVFPKQKHIISSEKIYTNNTSKRIAFCRDAVLLKDSLLLGFPHGLYSYNLQTKREVLLSNGRIYNIYHDTTTQKTWFTTNNGLKQYKNGQTKSITHKGNEILKAKTLAVDNQIWVSSKNGIFIFKNDSIINHLTQKDGLLINDIDNIKYEHPNVYLASKKGMQHYNINTKTFTNFTFSDGLTKRISQFEVLNDTIYSINSNGLLTFTFNNKNNTKKQYKTLITKAKANGTIKINNKSTLNPDEKNLFFSFLTPTFKHQKEIQYQYQLIGVDKKPIKASENQLSANYGNVASGNYTFKVDSFLNGKKNKSAILHFKIANYWYKTLWFRVLIVALSLFILYYIYRLRLKTVLRKRNEEKMKKRLAESSLISLKAQMNPHFMFNTINSIQSLILSKERTDAYKHLNQLADLIRSTLQMSNDSFVSLEREIKLIQQYLELEKLRFEEDFDFSIYNSINNLEVKIPSMVIQPFVENALKHGLLHKNDNKKLSITFSQKNKLITCIIIDNGIGRKASEIINKNKVYESFSTQAIKKRFDILKEYYKLDIGYQYKDLYDDKGNATGTEVTIKIIAVDEYK